MRLLAIDIGGHTQDILLFDSDEPVENSFNMIMPSPTTIAATEIKEATTARSPVVFTGVNSGGGPSFWALIAHLEAGLKAYATPEAARSFDDDLDRVTSLGVKLVSEDEAKKIRKAQHIVMQDVDLVSILVAFRLFGIAPNFHGLAVAALDHGVAPRGVSDRVFRFRHVKKLMEKHNEILSFAYRAEELPSYLTRMKTIATTLSSYEVPVLLMDTGPAAAMGALEDPQVAGHERMVALNAGNYHTLAFHLEGSKVLGFFEHHTGMLTSQKVDGLIRRLVSGELTNKKVFGDGGHGAWVSRSAPGVPFLTVTGPQRSVMSRSRLKPYMAAPYGSMMMAGCFGLVRAYSLRFPRHRAEIERGMKPRSTAQYLRPRPAN